MRRIFKRMTALAALTALVLCAGCGASDPAPAAAEARTGERETLGLLMAREDPFLTELKEQIQAEAAARGYDVRAYNAGNDPEAQLRQVHQVLADGVETLLVNLAEGEDAEKIAGIVGDAGVVLINRAPETAILNDRMVFVGMDEAGAGALQGRALADYFWETDHGTDLRYLLFQRGAVVQHAAEPQRHADKDEHPYPFRCLRDPLQPFERAAEQNVLPEQITAGVAADAQFRKDEQLRARLLRLPDHADDRIRVVTHVRHADLRRGGGDFHKTVFHSLIPPDQSFASDFSSFALL